MSKMKKPKYLVLCSPKDGLGGSGLHFTSQLAEKNIKTIFSMFIKLRHKPTIQFNILFFTGYTYGWSFGYKRKSAEFKPQHLGAPRKFFKKERLLVVLRNIAKKYKYFVKRNDWWRPPKLVYKKRPYPVCKWRRFTVEEMIPLWETFSKEGAYLYRDAIPRIVSNFLHKHGFPTPNMESRVKAFSHMFWDFYDAALLIATQYEAHKKWQKTYSIHDAAYKMKTCWYRNKQMIDLICAKLSKLNYKSIVHTRVMNPGTLISKQ